MIDNIFKGVKCEILQKGDRTNFNKIEYNSQEIGLNDIFVALIGVNTDGHKYIDSAISNGAAMIIVEKKDISYPKGVYIVYVENLRHNLGKIASNFYNYPQNELILVGITGTNGKTTSTYILESVLKNSSRIGTTGYRIGDKEYIAKNTTPESLDIIKLMRESVDKGIKYFIMEVSSHALCQGRVDILKFDSAIFTNLTQDHLDFHNSMEEYFEAKASILEHLKEGAKLVVNKDDKYCKRLLDRSDSFSLKEEADIRGEVIEYTLKGMLVKVIKNNKEYIFNTKLMGAYNLQNILGAIQALYNLGFDMEYIVSEIEKISSISGRFELIENDRDVMVVVDYAHTPDGLENILKTLSEIKKAKIVTLFGAGGDRDKTKRPLMAEACCKYSDYVYITSDNPRTEDPINILNDIEKGMTKNVKYVKIIEREKAIKEAINSLEKNDILLIAGKGHENYQIIGKEVIHFDDREVAKKYLGGR